MLTHSAKPKRLVERRQGRRSFKPMRRYISFTDILGEIAFFVVLLATLFVLAVVMSNPA